MALMSINNQKDAAAPLGQEKPLIEVKGLKTEFRLAEGVITAVNGVDLQLYQGETLALVGESGCGKSVTALSIIGLVPDPPGRIAGGEIHFNGVDLLKLSERKMRRIRGKEISMIFQEPMTALNPVYRIGTIMGEVIRLHQGASSRQALDKAVEMLTRVGIPDPERRLREYPHNLSGGIRQRVMIAMALSSRPKVLIADEPTTALDVTIQAQILDLMNNLKDNMGTSYLLITHDLGVVAQMAQRAAVMYTGQVVEYAPVKNLFEDPLHPYTVGLMESIPRMDEPTPLDKKLKAIPGMVPNLLKLPRGCTFQDRCNRVFEQCRVERPPLFQLNDKHSVRCWLHG